MASPESPLSQRTAHFFFRTILAIAVFFALKTRLTLLGTPISFAQFVQLTIEAVLKLFDAAPQIPHPLDEVLCEPWGVF